MVRCFGVYTVSMHTMVCSPGSSVVTTIALGILVPVELVQHQFFRNTFFAGNCPSTVSPAASDRPIDFLTHPATKDDWDPTEDNVSKTSKVIVASEILSSASASLKSS